MANRRLILEIDLEESTESAKIAKAHFVEDQERTPPQIAEQKAKAKVTVEVNYLRNYYYGA